MRGGPAYILRNINPSVGLANGTKVLFHSLVFKNDKERQEAQRLLDTAQPGERVDLPFPPAFVNVEVPGVDARTWSAASRVDCPEFRTKVVVPISWHRASRDEQVPPVGRPVTATN